MNSTGVIVLDSFPLRKADGEILDSTITTMEDGILYVVIVNGEGQYKSPFSFNQVVGWVSCVLNSHKVVICEMPPISDPTDKSKLILDLSRTLSNLDVLPYIEPVNGLTCYESTLLENNPYVKGVINLFSNKVPIGVEGVDINLSRKDIYQEMIESNDMDKYFSLLTPQSYQSMVNYRRNNSGTPEGIR